MMGDDADLWIWSCSAYVGTFSDVCERVELRAWKWRLVAALAARTE